jgi:hypothetical protein
MLEAKHKKTRNILPKIPTSSSYQTTEDRTFVSQKFKFTKKYFTKDKSAINIYKKIKNEILENLKNSHITPSLSIQNDQELEYTPKPKYEKRAPIKLFQPNYDLNKQENKIYMKNRNPILMLSPRLNLGIINEEALMNKLFLHNVDKLRKRFEKSSV